uniref:Pancreatic trypsin inhibitor n=1 Tax=Rhipicephalus appendiculatus TaxID=34631 RepID=A0A131YRP9_RHIAP
MVSAQTLLVMLLPAVLFFLQEAHGSVVVEERDIVCDRLLGACRYRDACACNPTTRLGLRSARTYYYRRGRCHAGGFARNCNGFPTRMACHSACIGFGFGIQG